MTDIKKHINYWKKSAVNNWQTALDIFKTKHYDACLFFYHLTIEKLLKGLAVKKIKKAAPFTHDLTVLAQVADIELLEKEKELLRVINTFNISTRYDDYKFQFYKKATRIYADKYLKKSHKLYLWLIKKY